MVFKITSTELARRSARNGLTLVEMLVALGTGSILLAALGTFSYFASFSFSSFANYVDLDRYDRRAVDTLTRDIRQVNKVTSFTVDSTTQKTNSVTFEDADGLPLTYAYNRSNQTLTRSKDGLLTMLLTNCTSLAFSLCQRTPSNGTYNVFPLAWADTAKVVDVSWVCSRSVLGKVVNSESVQTARIVIRKQGK